MAFRELGAPVVALGGNLKADLPAPRPLHAGWDFLRTGWAGHPVLVAGNTLEGEEELVLDAWRAARASQSGLRLILAPRQPRRFEAVARLLAGRGLACFRASGTWPQDEAAWKGTEVLLLDTLGELPAAYGEGTLAVVAGGWAASGGHNPLEAIRAGLPTLMGPGYGNFDDLVQPLRSAGLLDILPAEGIGTWIEGTLAAAPLRSAGTVPLPEALTGAMARTWSLIAPHLPTR
jgi:3-deoxy-D-manno-octulosonic-acid transferase